MYARQKIKIYLMLQGSMVMIYSTKNNIKKQQNCIVKHQEHFNKYF